MVSSRKLEKCFTPENDSALMQLGIEVCAVTEEKDGRITNQIMFKRDDKYQGIECVHKKICDLVPDKEDEMVVIDYEPKKLELMKLSLEENFEFMESFVSDLVDFGIEEALEEALMLEKVTGEETLDLKTDFRREIAKSIIAVAPELEEDFEGFIRAEDEAEIERKEEEEED